MSAERLRENEFSIVGWFGGGGVGRGGATTAGVGGVRVVDAVEVFPGLVLLTDVLSNEVEVVLLLAGVLSIEAVLLVLGGLSVESLVVGSCAGGRGSVGEG